MKAAIVLGAGQTPVYGDFAEPVPSAGDARIAVMDTQDIETVFMMTAPEFAYLSSTLIREVAGFRGSVSGLIPPVVERRLTQKLSRSHRKKR